jgi:release factor glutamine methyltransferase
MVIVNFHRYTCKDCQGMKNSKEIFRDLQKQITLQEDSSEIKSILFLVLESVLGLSQSDIAAEHPVLLSESQQKKLNEVISRINAEEPVQYILGSSYFYGRKFNVNPAVLIPRSETEVLIEEVLKEVDPFSPGTILDIGTGSGCIAITLAKELPAKRVVAIDVSNDALQTAMENAQQLSAPVEFHKINALTEDFPFASIEVLVSNPPYVTTSEKTSLRKNVLNYEPHLALFVPDDDPFVFYTTIARKGYTILTGKGKAFVEINERYGNEVADIFRDAGFKNVWVVKDLQGKNRIVTASKQ